VHRVGPQSISPKFLLLGIGFPVPETNFGGSGVIEFGLEIERRFRSNEFKL
jgi:hypothetical protein